MKAYKMTEDMAQHQLGHTDDRRHGTTSTKAHDRRHGTTSTRT